LWWCCNLIVQELLNSVMKHAQAREVFVQVTHEDDQVYLNVEDDGAAPRAGIGLAGIRTRVGLLGEHSAASRSPAGARASFCKYPCQPASTENRAGYLS